MWFYQHAAVRTYVWIHIVDSVEAWIAESGKLWKRNKKMHKTKKIIFQSEYKNHISNKGKSKRENKMLRTILKVTTGLEPQI